jgi:hypothetical protein
MDEYDIIQSLIALGAMEFAGVDSNTGEMLYNFTPKLKEVMPELYQMHQNSINSQVMRLWELGFVNVDLFSESPLVTLTEKAFDDYEISLLSEDDKFSIEEIKRVLLY